MTHQRYPIVGPWKGIVGDVPSAYDDQAFDDSQNVFFRKGRIQSRPPITSQGQVPDQTSIVGYYSFKDILAKYHTLITSLMNAYALTAIGGGSTTVTALTLPGGLNFLSSNSYPMAFQEMNEQLFFCDGSVPLLFWDGSQNIQVAGDVPGSCFYLTENSEHLIGVNWIEPSPGYVYSTLYPNRVRWSDENAPTVWTPDIGNTAGVADLIEAGGALTGCATLGRNTYITRQEGASVLYPTGVATAPFGNEPYMWSRPGWGVFFPYSLVVWTNYCISLTRECEVLLFDGSNFTRLAGQRVKSRLSQDIGIGLDTGQDPNTLVYAFATDTLGPGLDFEGYWICVGRNLGSLSAPNYVSWVHNLEEGTWQRITNTQGPVTAANYVVTQ